MPIRARSEQETCDIAENTPPSFFEYFDETIESVVTSVEKTST